MIVKKMLVGGLIASFSLGVFAGNGSGLVERVITQSTEDGGRVFFSVGTLNNPPSCHNTATTDFALDITTALGRSQYAQVLTAQASGQTLSVTGTDDCSVWPDREAVNFMFVSTPQ